MTRKLVGQLFSSKGAVPVFEGLPSDESKRINCFLNNESGATVGYFEGYETTKVPNPFLDNNDAVKGVEFIFSSLFKQPILFKTSLFFQDMELSFFLPGSSHLSASNSSPLYIEGYDNVNVTAYLNIKSEKTQIDCGDCGNVSGGMPYEPKQGTVKPNQGQSLVPAPVPSANGEKATLTDVPPVLEPVDPNQPPVTVYKPVIKLHMIDEGSEEKEAQSYTVDCSGHSNSSISQPIIQPVPGN
jgi:hypothetical protein